MLKKHFRPFRIAAKLDPDWAFVHYSIAEVLNNLKQFNEALVEIEIAIKMDANCFYYYECLAAALRGLNRLDEATVAEQKCTELFQQTKIDEDNE